MAKGLNGLTTCNKCGAMYMGTSVVICAKCGNDMSKQNENDSDSKVENNTAISTTELISSYGSSGQAITGTVVEVASMISITV